VTELIKRLENKKNVINTMGKTALYLAVEYKTYSMVRILVEGGVDVTPRDIHGKSVLDMAIERGQGEVVHMLLKKGADFDENTLYWAAARGHEAVVRMPVKEKTLNDNESKPTESWH
jgi:ankyrin repeat protein